MKKTIVTTTIFPPSKAMLKYADMDEWDLVIVGDLKTPHELYRSLESSKSNVKYLSPEEQESEFKELSDSIGWNSIQRRNVGFVYAYKKGADIIATVDDDNIPYDNWGKNILVGQEIECDCYEPENEKVFDPLSITKDNYLWHRGYPIQLLKKRLNVDYVGKIKRKVLVQANLWDGDPDIDAMARLTYKPIVKYSDIEEPYCSSYIAPFNSQNTILSREVIPYYAVLPHIGRMDDIWGSYILQKYFPNSVVYDVSTVYQDRNVQDLITNLEKEVIGYRNTLSLIEDLNNYEKFLPKEALEFYKIYRNQF